MTWLAGGGPSGGECRRRREHLPTTLLPLFAGLEPVVAADGATVAEALSALDGRWPGLMDRLCEPGPRLRRHIRVCVDRSGAELATPVEAGGRVDVLSAITGG